MGEPKKPLDVAIALTKAWTSRDMTTAARYVDEKVVFDGPMQQSTGAKPYLDGLARLGKEVTDLHLLAAFGDDEQALLMYDLVTTSYGTLTCAKHVLVKDGKVRHDKLTFDSNKIRSAKAA